MTATGAKVMIVGASGLVGDALFEEFGVDYDLVGTYCNSRRQKLIHLDVRDRGQIQSVIAETKPDVIICSAAEPNVELCEREPAATRQVNVDGLQNLISAALDVDAALVYFSSEYVFDGSSGPYRESDMCHALNEYGRQKLECERAIAGQLKRYIIGRISGVYNWEPARKNFVVRMIDALAQGQTFKVPSDQVITPTYAPNLARVVRALVEQECWGLFHLAGSEPMLRDQFARLVADVFDLDASLVLPNKTCDLNLCADRPLSAGLDVAKAQSLLSFPIADPLEGLRSMKALADWEIGRSMGLSHS